ncbi:MAG: SRPBCC domain-containing protein [Bacteroidota bacterium]
MDLNKAYYFGHSSQLVYNAWINPELSIPPITQIYIDPKVGGKIDFYTSNPEDHKHLVGTFLQVESGFRILYTWHWEGSKEHTQVSVLLNTFGAGCLVSLLHKGFNSRKSCEMHKNWWDNYVNELKLILKDQTVSTIAKEPLKFM